MLFHCTYNSNLFNVISEFGWTPLHRHWRRNTWRTFLVVVFVYGCPWLQIGIHLIRWQGINEISVFLSTL
jgi:hypothetical protein